MEKITYKGEHMKHRTKKILKWVFIGSILTVITLFSLLVCFLTLVFFGGPPKKSDDFRDYQEIFELRLSSGSGLIVFPEELSTNMTDIDFSYYYRDTWNMPTVSIFLQGTYTPEEYEAEVERLEKTRKVYGGTERVLLRDEEGKFPYPAYIAVENHHQHYEYALLTGENQITYIYTAFFEVDDVEFDKKYLPTDFMTAEGREFGSGYSIYIKSVGAGISYDTSREEYVEVMDAYSEDILDSTFWVSVKLDEQNREIIQYCKFSYYEPPADRDDVDTYDWESDDTFWYDLEGYEFVDLRLNQERTAAVVTYLANGQEEKWHVELVPYMTTKESE